MGRGCKTISCVVIHVRIYQLIEKNRQRLMYQGKQILNPLDKLYWNGNKDYFNLTLNLSATVTQQ